MGEDLRWYRPVPGARFTLVCLPHAGGNATAFRGWPAFLPADVALAAACYPGRLNRYLEPAARTIAELAGLVAEAVIDLPGPVVIFGHSMGAVVAYEVTARLEAAGRPPRLLVISGREAPHLADRAPGPTHDADMLARFHALGGIPDEALDDAELRELVLAPLRADVALLDAHAAAPAPPVRTPIVAYLGVDDPGCTPAQIDGWSALTTGRFRRRLLTGDHFSVLARPGVLLSDLCEQV
ncbi:alpha/beta fold hydrolase [Solwaraspora sp. WMMD1047]|uniref:thioesterase II family protein n=1 Tax=Solwaraspora sp. WMMD1047 TaxID=3016102 RepID=UPI002415A9FE|nr:alpha/beta fold hydrolase [Solwaraspora sp. WMMD1047]MDG4834252.1 alpha/beta fold hydrolase [Solwaraspora sp. WMMD1047]